MKISASLAKCYKQCRRKYELRYKEELVPIATAQALKYGTDYHAGIEKFYKEGVFNYDENNPKVSAMVTAYIMKIAPQFPVSYAEKWFEYKLTPKHTIVGKNDAIAYDGTPVEHKTTSGDVDEDYIYKLQWDEQILTYMLANGINKMYYTVCKKPTIRQRQNETSEEFYKRCLQWYEEDTDRKLRIITVERSEEEIKEHRKNLIALAREIEGCKNFYRNPCACDQYGRRCEYSSVCLNYDPHFQYVEFEKKKRYAETQESEEENGIF